MIHKILIPTDGNGLEDHVIRYVARVFPSAEFYVVSVINTRERGVQLTTLLYKEMKSSAEKAIERATQILAEEGIENIHHRILEGLPSRIINRYAKKKDIDLIALRVYSRKFTVSAQRMGSTIRNVIQGSTVPVLIVAEECEKIPVKRVLFPTDGTRKSERAKNFAILFASSYGIEIEVMHVMGKGSHRHHVEEILKNTEWKASFLDVKVKKIMEEGDVVEHILKHASDNDMVIMGVGRKFLLWHYIGHVTQAIITHSPVPVILVPCIKRRWEQRMLRR